MSAYFSIDSKVQVMTHLVDLLAPVDSLLREVPTQTRTVPDGSALSQAHGDDIVFSRKALHELAVQDKNDDFVGLGLRVSAANYRSVAAADLNRTRTIRPFLDIDRADTRTQNAFMAAEVGRLETQYVSLYPGLLAPFEYDVAAVLNGMVNDRSTRRMQQVGADVTLQAYTFIALRPYANAALFNELYDLAVQAGHPQHVIEEIAKIGEEFATLQWDRDATKGRRLAQRLGELVDMPEETRPDCGQQGTTGKPDPDLAERAAQQAKDNVEEAERGGDPFGNSTPQEGAGAPQEGEGDGEGTEGQGEGQEGSQRPQGGAGGLQEQLRQQMEQARSSQAGQETENKVRQAAEVAGVGIDSAAFSHRRQEVSPQARVLRNQLTKVFTTLIERTAGGVSYNAKRGKLVPLDRRMGKRRYRSTVMPNRRNELTIDVAVLVDVSGSMQDQAHPLGEAIWAIKGGIDDVARRARGLAKSRVWQYNYESSLLYAEGQPLHPGLMVVPKPDGGTNPLVSLQKAKAWFDRSKANTRMLVMLTDGQWSNTQAADKVVKEIGDQPGTATVLFGMGGSIQYGGDHGFQHAFDLEHLPEMVVHTKNAIAHALRDRVGV